MPSYKDKLITKYGRVEASRMLSEQMTAIRAKVKTPGLANLGQEQRREVARKVWATRRANALKIKVEDTVRAEDKNRSSRQGIQPVDKTT